VPTEPAGTFLFTGGYQGRWPSRSLHTVTKQPRIVVTVRLPAAAADFLRDNADPWFSPHDRALSPAELHAAVAGADGAVVSLADRIDDAFLDAAGAGLRVVANVGVGYNNVDVPACAARGVTVTNTPGVLTDATADLSFALILMATRRLGEAERLVRTGRPWSFGMGFMLGTGISGKTLGIVGLGQIGAAVAQRARAAGMEIVYTQRSPAATELDARFLPLDELLATADVISLHTPLTPDTHHRIGGRELARMKPTAFLVNTSRGAVVDESALVDALRNGTIAGAGLDVYEHEPDVHPGLLELENVVLLPHVGSATTETRTAMAMLAARNAVAVTRGEEPLTPVAQPIA
jgi:lactate dehydrogenase-like 2-hydroxyacid dehydrogenase